MVFGIPYTGIYLVSLKVSKPMNIENYHRVSLEKTDNFQNPTKFLTSRELDLGFLGRAIQACTSYQNCRTQAPDSAFFNASDPLELLDPSGPYKAIEIGGISPDVALT